MIELDCPRERMLEELGAAASVPELALGADGRWRADFVALEQARLVVRAHTPAEILPELGAALSARFAAVAPEALERDLLAPLKKAVGNAHKRGNLGSPAKWITVEVLVTPLGVLLEVSDEGAGFDVATTHARYRAGGTYFLHGGSGFRKFDKARARVSFANGGRTLRACYRASPAKAAPRIDDPAPAGDHRDPRNPGRIQ